MGNLVINSDNEKSSNKTEEVPKKSTKSADRDRSRHNKDKERHGKRRSRSKSRSRSRSRDRQNRKHKKKRSRDSDHHHADRKKGNQNLVRGLVRPVLGGIEDMSDRPEVRNVAKEKLLPLAYGFRREQPSSRGHERIFNVDIQFVVEA